MTGHQAVIASRIMRHFPNDDAVVKLLWLAIINIEDKRARLVEGQRVTGWREALSELDLAYPGQAKIAGKPNNSKKSTHIRLQALGYQAGCRRLVLLSRAGFGAGRGRVRCGS
jgi:hypothetical protein